MILPFAVDALVLRFFLLLLSGHLLSDFLFQSGRIARDKGHRPGALLLHGLWTWTVHALVLFPFWSGAVLLGLAALALLHMGIDWFKPRVLAGGGRTLGAFFTDQGLHLLSLLALGAAAGAWSGPRLAFLEPGGLDAYATAAVIAAGFAFIGKGGTAVVRLILNRFPRISEPLREDRGAYAMGLVIGNLERFILYLLVLLGQWGALGFVIAAKSVARFKELDEKGFADYYLIGTLASVLTALAAGVTAKLLISTL